MEKIWLKHYPAGVPAEIDAGGYTSLVALLQESFTNYRERSAYRYMGQSLSYGQIDTLSQAFAAWLQGQGLARGDRVAVMLPNVPQYPVAVAAILRAGYVVVNVNPLYTPRELEHQLKDAGAKVLIILENFAHTLQQVRANVPVQSVVLASMGELLSFPKSTIVDFVVRRVKKLVPAYELPGAVRFKDALAQGRSMTLRPVAVGPDDIAVLQYTGGTTGVSKGAVLLHRNLIANVLQCGACDQPALKKLPAGDATGAGLRAAAVSHLRLQHEHDAGHAGRRLQRADPESA